MTQERLRELLQERVADEAAPDLAAGAWQRARVVRRRRRLGAAAGVVAATVAVSGGIAVLDGRPADEPPPADVGVPAEVTPDATVRGVAVWYSPDLEEEHALPRLEAAGLPRELDAAAGAPALAEQPVERAVVSLAVLDDDGLDHVVVITPSGERRAVDLTGWQQVSKPNGYRFWPTGELSPDGQYLLVPQDGSVRLLRLADASWTEVTTTDPTYDARWLGDGVFALSSGQLFDETGASLGRADVSGPPTFPLAGGAMAYGRPRTSPGATRVAQAWGMGTDLSGAEAIWVDPGRAAGAALAFPLPGPAEGRWKDCCPVAGWLSEDRLVYESRSADPVLVAWTVGTARFAQVSRISGFVAGEESYAASWAF